MLSEIAKCEQYRIVTFKNFKAFYLCYFRMMQRLCEATLFTISSDIRAIICFYGKNSLCRMQMKMAKLNIFTHKSIYINIYLYTIPVYYWI